MVVVDNKKRSCKIIDFAVPGDSIIEGKEKDKTEKYQDLAREQEQHKFRRQFYLERLEY